MSYLSRPLPSSPRVGALPTPPVRAGRRRVQGPTLWLILACLAAVLGTGGASAAWAGYSALVVDAASGRVLFARNADTRNYPASLTKMMTLYLLFEAIDQGKVATNQKLTVSARAAGQPPSKLGVGAGTTITVDQAIRALVTRSANDVAVVVAEALAGSESAFAARMTAKARALGMVNTTFRNASGLPDPGQTSSARDMVTLGLALQRHFPSRYHYFGIESFRFGNRTITTHNHVLQRYPGADGLKTGYIRASGFNVVSSAVRNGHRLMAAVFGGRTALERDTHMMALLDQGFAELNRPGSGGRPIEVAQRSPKASKPAPVPMGSADDAPRVPPRKPGRADDAAPRGQAVAMASLPTPAPTPAKAASASASASPPPSPPPSGSSGAGAGTWGVQVGAYGTSEAASTSAGDARSFLKASVKKALQATVLPHQAASGPLYRARVMGMNEREARTACTALKRAKRSCLIVLPSGSSMVPR